MRSSSEVDGSLPRSQFLPRLREFSPRKLGPRELSQPIIRT